VAGHRDAAIRRQVARKLMKPPLILRHSQDLFPLAAGLMIARS
jgi:hypothetical protein